MLKLSVLFDVVVRHGDTAMRQFPQRICSRSGVRRKKRNLRSKPRQCRSPSGLLRYVFPPCPYRIRVRLCRRCISRTFHQFSSVRYSNRHIP